MARHDVAMSTVAKFLVGLALILPMAGYVVGSLVSSSSGEPERRDPVIVSNVQPPADDESTPASPDARPPGSGGRGTGTGDRSTGPVSSARDDDERVVDENGITVVTPEPSRPANGGNDGGDDDGDDDGDGGDDDRDDRDETDDDGDGGGDDD